MLGYFREGSTFLSIEKNEKGFNIMFLDFWIRRDLKEKKNDLKERKAVVKNVMQQTS